MLLRISWALVQISCYLCWCLFNLLVSLWLQESGPFKIVVYGTGCTPKKISIELAPPADKVSRCSIAIHYSWSWLFSSLYEAYNILGICLLLFPAMMALLRTQLSFVKCIYHCIPFAVFTCESSYCFQRILAIAILSVHLSVRHVCHPWVDQSKVNRHQHATVIARGRRGIQGCSWTS